MINRVVYEILFSSCWFLLGDLMDEAAVLEWLIQNRSTGDEDDVIEDVDLKSLETMIQSIEHLAVLFCKNLCNY